MIQIVPYQTTDKNQWNEFVRNSKNATFLLQRDYMDYHSDRFEDASLMILKDNKLIACLPANRRADNFYSHQGLTYGGFISNKKMRVQLMLEIFEATIEYLQKQGIKSFVYKPIPHIYHQMPAEEDLYALFRFNANLYYRNISTVIESRQLAVYNNNNKRLLKKSREFPFEIGESKDFEGYMKIVASLLNEKFDADPVHSTEEIKLLAERFPKNIRLFTTQLEGEIQGGVIIFETSTCAHSQYIASTDEGRENGALNALFDQLIHQTFSNKKFFDFGTSNEQGGKVLNTGLIRNKESYGARGVVYDGYVIEL